MSTTFTRTTLVDTDQLKTIRKLELASKQKGLLEDVVTHFLLNAPHWIEQMEDALLVKDEKEFHLAAGAMLSSASMVGAELLQQECRNLIESVEFGTVAEVEIGFTRLHDNWAKLRPLLAFLLNNTLRPPIQTN